MCSDFVAACVAFIILPFQILLKLYPKNTTKYLKNINKKDIKILMAPWLNWTEQLPPKGQVAGSNPAGVTNKSHKLKHQGSIQPQTNYGSTISTSSTTAMPVSTSSAAPTINGNICMPLGNETSDFGGAFQDNVSKLSQLPHVGPHSAWMR